MERLFGELTEPSLDQQGRLNGLGTDHTFFSVSVAYFSLTIAFVSLPLTTALPAPDPHS